MRLSAASSGRSCDSASELSCSTPKEEEEDVLLLPLLLLLLLLLLPSRGRGLNTLARKASTADSSAELEKASERKRR